MLKVSKINKSYNKGKKNQVNAIVQTDVEFPKKGLVVLFGPSGSGKTTLLNVLGGLEYVDSGEITFDEMTINRRNRNKLDTIRNERIGYVFQSYNLLPTLTVYENIEFVLTMLGIKDKAEIERRILYVLESVGMLNFRNRRVTALSGGQQQRIGIARAIAKNPEIVIADEPTGNLDSRNTIDIMNIIKKISQEKLVILVTHEQEIARFYGDRIIEIRDGKIVSDNDNVHNNSLNIRHNNTIYLKDLNHEVTQDSNVSVNQYYEGEKSKDSIKVTLISKDDMIYVQVDGVQSQKIRFIDSESEVEIINDHYKGIEKQDVDQSTFSFNQFTETAIKRKGSVITLWSAVKYGFQRIKNYKRLQKLMFLGFVFSAAIIAFGIALVGKYNAVYPTDFQRVDSHYIRTDDQDYDSLKNESSILYINPIDSPQSLYVEVKEFYQVNTYMNLQAHPNFLPLISESDIVLGRYPENQNEIVVDKMVLEPSISMDEFKQLSITSYSDFLDRTIHLSYNSSMNYKIVGISDMKSPSIYMESSLIYKIAFQDINCYFDSVSSFESEDSLSNYHIESGREPQAVGEILYPEENKGEFTLNQQLQPYGNTPSAVIVGFYTTTDELGLGNVIAITTNDLYIKSYYEWSKYNDILVYSTNTKQTIAYLKDQNHTAVNMYEKNLKEYQTAMRQLYTSLLVFGSIMLGVSLLQLYFIVRSSLISRIYEIGVYRSLGASRWDIQKMFMMEIIILTTFTSLVGYGLATWVIKEIEQSLSRTISPFYFPFYYVVGGALLVYLINVISGLFPVYRLLRKSPSQILKQYDA